VRIVTLDGRPREYDDFLVTAMALSATRAPFVTNWMREERDLPRIAAELKAMSAGYDVVHAHHKASAIAASMAGLPRCFLTIRDYWPVCICGRSMYRTGAVCSRGDFGRCSRHDGWWKGIAAPLVYPWFEARMNERIRQMQNAKLIFCISHYVRQQLVPFFDPQKLDVLPNFAEEIAAPAPVDLPERFVLYVGRLEENKGPQLLPEIISASGVRWPLLLIGEGSLKETLMQEFTKQEVDARFLGYREYPEMLQVLARCESVLFPSTWAEPLGRVLIEAAMLGKAAVAFSHPGGHLDIVENERTGLLADTPESFAKAVTRLASDDSLRQRLGTEARARYERLFSPQVVLSRLVQAYER
jgi:glycosyltransferase involved in cell wall biosynthesis